MELVRLVAWGTRSVAFGNEFLDVECDLVEDLSHDACAQGGGDECAGQYAAQDVEGQCSVDAPCGIGHQMALGGAPRSQCGEVVAHGLCHEVLAGGQPGQAAGVLEVESMLETLERLLDAPALVVEFGKGLEGETLGVALSTLLFAGGALAQHAAHHQHGHAHAVGRSAEEAPSTVAYREINDRMHADMNVEFTGDADIGFLKSMIPHHEGAVAMARVVLEHGTDENVRQLAEEIIAAQEAEIEMMRAWLTERGY